MTFILFVSLLLLPTSRLPQAAPIPDGLRADPIVEAVGLGAELQPRAYLPLVGFRICGWLLPFEDTFTDNNDQGWTPVVGAWEIAGEEYRLQSRDGVDEYTFIGGECWSEYILRVDLRYTNGELTNDYGIAFYVSPDYHSLYKLMIIGPDIVRLLYVPNRARDEYEELDRGRSPVPFEEGKWYTLQAWVRQGRIRGSINGITVIDVEDTRNTQGMIGLMSDGFPALLHYDNVKVY